MMRKSDAHVSTEAVRGDQTVRIDALFQLLSSSTLFRGKSFESGLRSEENIRDEDASDSNENKSYLMKVVIPAEKSCSELSSTNDLSTTAHEGGLILSSGLGVKNEKDKTTDRVTVIGQAAKSCPVCLKMVRGRITDHLKEHDEEKSFKRDKRLFKYSRGSQSIVHEKSPVKKKLFRCDHCDREFKYRSLLIKHLRTHYKTVKCNLCTAEFINQMHLEDHIKFHSSIGSCVANQMESPLPWHLTSNLHTHTQDGIDPCEICCKIFTQQLEPAFYVGTRYSCDRCHETFKTNGDLLEHMQIHMRQELLSFRISQSTPETTGTNHASTGTWMSPCSCSQCVAILKLNIAPLNHIHNSAGDEWLSCKICSQEIRTQGH